MEIESGATKYIIKLSSRWKYVSWKTGRVEIEGIFIRRGRLIQSSREPLRKCTRRPESSTAKERMLDVGGEGAGGGVGVGGRGKFRREQKATTPHQEET